MECMEIIIYVRNWMACNSHYQSNAFLVMHNNVTLYLNFCLGLWGQLLVDCFCVFVCKLNLKLTDFDILQSRFYVCKKNIYSHFQITFSHWTQFINLIDSSFIRIVYKISFKNKVFLYKNNHFSISKKKLSNSILTFNGSQILESKSVNKPQGI